MADDPIAAPAAALRALLDDRERLAELVAALRAVGLQLTEKGTAELIDDDN